MLTCAFEHVDFAWVYCRSRKLSRNPKVFSLNVNGLRLSLTPMKKEKQKQYIFASMMIALGLITLCTGYWGFRALSAGQSDLSAGQFQVLVTNVLHANDVSGKPKFLRVAKQEILMSHLLSDSYSQMRSKDEKLSKELITQLAQLDKKTSNFENSIEELRQKLSSSVRDPNLNALIQQSIAGYAFINGDFDRAAEIMSGSGIALDETKKQQCLFEIHYNRYLIAQKDETTNQSNRSIEAIDAALAALRAMDPASEIAATYEFDGLELLHLKADIHMSLIEKQDEMTKVVESANQLKVCAERLKAKKSVFTVSDTERNPETHGFRRELVGPYYLGLAYMILGKQDYRDYERYKEPEDRKRKFDSAWNHYVLAFEQLAVDTTWLFLDDEKMALIIQGEIYAGLEPIFDTQSSNYLDDLKRHTTDFESKIDDYKTRVEKNDYSWKSNLKKDNEAYNNFLINWRSDWNNLEKKWDDQSQVALQYASKLEAKFPRDSYASLVAKSDRELRTSFEEKMKEKNKFVDASDKVIKDAKDLDKMEPKKSEIYTLHRNLSAIEDCLTELNFPNQDGAIRCVAKLDALIKNTTTDQKIIQDATELSKLIKNLFRAEASLSDAKKGKVDAANEADVKEARAQEYLRPTRLNGTVRTELARQNMQEADELRRNAEKRLTTASESVLEQVRLTAKAAQIYKDDTQNLVAAVLSGVAYAVIERSEVPFQGEIPFTENEVKEIKNKEKTVEGVIQIK